MRDGDDAAAALAMDEARDIARTLRCQPMADRAARMMPAQRPVEAWRGAS
jgi:hypothetical protein